MDDHVAVQQFKYLLKRYVDSFIPGRFGNPENPCLLSVRSGAVFSMPGIMDTITNIGLTSPIIDYYAEKDMWFAYDCYRRFIQDIVTSYYGLDRRIFENLMYESKKEAGVELKQKLSGEQMKSIALKYKQVVEDKYNCYVPEEPYEQLLFGIIAVYRSWDAEIAKKYREFTSMSDEWGTSVIVQKMAFGNKSPHDITGVVHSHYAGDEKISLFGEYKTRAQGHDIVSGVARVFPISEDQKKVYIKSARYERQIRCGGATQLRVDFKEIYSIPYDGNTGYHLKTKKGLKGEALYPKPSPARRAGISGSCETAE
jgi:pyruvate,orthophosphate dikinase